MFYVSFIISLSLLAYFITKLDFEKIIKVILTFSFVILLPPLIDFVLSFGTGFKMAYFFPLNIWDFLFNFLTFFIYLKEGVTIGIKIELFLILIISAYYLYLKKTNIKKNILFVFLTYFLFSLYSVFPTIFESFFLLFGLRVDFFELVVFLYLILIFLQVIIIFLIKYKITFYLIVKDFRFFRFFHFELMFLFGFLLSGVNFFNDLTGFFLVILSIFLACEFSVISNNFFDKKLDDISNKSRPIQKGWI